MKAFMFTRVQTNWYCAMVKQVQKSGMPYMLGEIKEPIKKSGRHAERVGSRMRSSVQGD